MVKMHTKLAIAFLATAVISVLIWDRGNKREPQLEGEEDFGELMADSDRVMHRSKRQVFGGQLQVMYKQFNDLQPCCAVPALMPTDALDACSPPVQQRTAPKNRVKTAGWLNNLNKFFSLNSAPIQASKPKTKIVTKNRGKRQTPQKIALSSVCYTNCAFEYANFLNDSALDLVLIEDTFVNKMSSPAWKQVIQDALYTCEEPAACATPETVNVNGKYCSIKPTIMMSCLRKQMILNCPTASRSSSNYKCNSGVSSLKNLNVLSFG